MISVNNNDEDIRLLYENPKALVEKYQVTIGIIVKKFIKTGLFHSEDKEDIIQWVNEKLLNEKMEKIQSQYNHLSYVATYFSAIVRNLCLEIHRNSKKELEIERNKDISEYEIHDKNIQPITNLIIQDELNRFDTILKFYHKSRDRLELCLKLIFRIEIFEEDIKKYCLNCTNEDVKIMMNSFGYDYDKLTDKEIYQIVTPIFGRYEKKRNTPDALRKWVNSKTEEIIGVLNGEPTNSNYDKETLKILVQKYYESEKMKK